MSINFTCENCGKRFKVDERSQGRRGRCSHCGHVMRIPGAAVAEHAHASGCRCRIRAEPVITLQTQSARAPSHGPRGDPASRR